MEIRNLNPAVLAVPTSGVSEPVRSTDGAATRAPVEMPAAAVLVTQQAQDNARMASEQQRELQESVDVVNEAVKVFNSSVRFSIDEDTKQRVVRVVDLETDEVIRQIPSEEVLAIAKVFDKLQGLLIKDKA